MSKTGGCIFCSCSGKRCDVSAAVLWVIGYMPLQKQPHPVKRVPNGQLKCEFPLKCFSDSYHTAETKKNMSH